MLSCLFIACIYQQAPIPALVVDFSSELSSLAVA